MRLPSDKPTGSLSSNSPCVVPGAGTAGFQMPAWSGSVAAAPWSTAADRWSSAADCRGCAAPALAGRSEVAGASQMQVQRTAAEVARRVLMVSGAGTCGEGERVFEAIVAPEHFGTHEESGSPEYIQATGRFGLLPETCFRLLEPRCAEEPRCIGRDTAERFTDGLGHIGIPILGEDHQHDAPAKAAYPWLVGGEQGDARCKECPYREVARSPPGQAVLAARPLDVTPHVGALLRLQQERRGGPPEALEDRPEQERPPQHSNAGRLCQGFDPHDAQVAVDACEIEPQLDGRRRLLCSGAHGVPVWAPRRCSTCHTASYRPGVHKR